MRHALLFPAAEWRKQPVFFSSPLLPDCRTQAAGSRRFFLPLLLCLRKGGDTAQVPSRGSQQVFFPLFFFRYRRKEVALAPPLFHHHTVFPGLLRRRRTKILCPTLFFFFMLVKDRCQQRRPCLSFLSFLAAGRGRVSILFLRHKIRSFFFHFFPELQGVNNGGTSLSPALSPSLKLD